MITTFLLNKDNSFVNFEESILDINPEGFINQGNLYKNLRSAIEWAISHDEDAIYCVCGSNFRYDFDINYLNKIINDLASEGIYSIYINADYKNIVAINEDLVTISNIRSVESFILLSPVYEVVLSLISTLEQNFSMEFNQFLETIIPNAFLLLKNKISNVISHKIYIISPFRNAVNYIDDYLNSVLKQSFRNYQIIMIDDCSTDNSKEKIPELPIVRKIINSKRQFALQNIIDVLMTNKFEDEDVICLVDADDMLPHKYVLNIIDRTYHDNSVLMTYGSMTNIDNIMKIGISYTKEEFDNLRLSDWKVTHLRTFKYKVFRELLFQDNNLNCLRDDTGKIFKMPYDMALLFPLLELAGYENIKFINTPTYQYRLHSENDHLKNRDEQYAGEIQIRRKKRFKQVF
ncbi:glycosyl transferase family 2 [Sphingobacterium sp. JUb20]|nr:glycosyl transferase family 2 [Sphingobacterium sp. JUb20]